MKYRNIILFSFVALLMGSCFEDEGNYEYSELKPPTWLINIEQQPIYGYGRGLSDMTLDATRVFTWGNLDSLKRSQEVRYEWVLNGKVISTEAKETAKTEEFMKRAGLTDYPTEALVGSFSIIEKESGVAFKARTYITFTPPITNGDFVVYSAKDGSGKSGVLSSLILDYAKHADGTETERFQFNPAVSAEIPGTPKTLTIAQALNVSYAGSVTAITKEGGATVFNAGHLKKEWEISSQFADAVPENFLVSDRRDQETSSSEPAFTWIATQDGRVFTRQTGKNYLGGKFLSEPYYLDDKGYKITKFGHTLWGITNIPCYDELNRRVILATCLPYPATNTYRCFMSALYNENRTGGVPISSMPEDTKVFHMSNALGGQGWYGDTYNTWYEIFYNSEGKSFMGTFAVDNRGRRLIDLAFADSRWKVIDGYTFTDETVFLIAATMRYRTDLKPLYDLFTDNTKIVAIIKNSNKMISDIAVKELPFKGIESKITCMTYDRANDVSYRHLLVGCENGDILVYNVETLPEPVLVKKYNVGGRVAAIKQLGINRTKLDLY